MTLPGYWKWEASGVLRPGDAAHFMLRVTRLGPLVPARIWLCDHDPAEESNKLDRGNLSVYPRAEIAGEEVDPDILQRDRLMSPTDWRPAYAPRHWKFAQPISQGEYLYQVARAAWAKVQARKPIDAAQLPLPTFDRENA